MTIMMNVSGVWMSIMIDLKSFDGFEGGAQVPSIMNVGRFNEFLRYKRFDQIIEIIFFTFSNVCWFP